MSSDIESVIDTDVLIIGGGLTGCRAALRAKDFCDSVTLVEKAHLARSGATVFAHTMLAAAEPDERIGWLKEIVEASLYLADQEWIEMILIEQPQRIRELEEIGVPFERDREGNLTRSLARGQKITRAINYDGMKLMEALREDIIHKGINLIERVAMTDLLTSDGRYPTSGHIVGAVGFHTRTGEFFVFKSKAVVITTGPSTSHCNFNYVDNLTGDGTVAAFRAGADLTGMENCHHGTFNYFERKFKIIGQSKLQGLGAYIVNREGERFMQRYDPDMKELSTLGLICQAMTKEVMEGRGPIYFDMRHFTQEKIETLRRVLPVLMKGLDDTDIDIRKQLVECTPLISIMGSGPGAGIKTNTDCESNVPGLFAAGSATKIPQGAANFGCMAQAYANVSGYRAGERAGKRAALPTDLEFDYDQANALKNRIFSPLSKTNGVYPDDLFLRIMELTTPPNYSLFKSEAYIKEVLEKIQAIEDQDLEQLCASDIHDLVKSNEARNMLVLAKLTNIAALERKESRGAHYRKDFPYRDDVDWLKWVVLRNKGEKVAVESVPVPFERYPIQPEKRVRVPHPIIFS